MTTANEYRQYAHECTVSAREATTDPFAIIFLSWLNCG